MNNKGRYHNDYSPRYQDAFDIYEKAKNHAKEQRKKERLHSLSVVEQESSLLKNYRPSSRIKRFVRQASERSGVSYHTGAITRRQTPATIAMSRGIQAFTVAGMADGNTALYSAENDIVENIDPEAMSQASKFVMTILKCI